MMPVSNNPEKSPTRASEALPDLYSWNGIKALAAKFFESFLGHDLMTLAAALAFYTALSLAPLLLITLSVVGLLGPESQTQLIQWIEGTMGPQASTAITAVIQSAQSQPQTSTLAGAIGIVTLLFSASGVFAQLQSSLNVIWQAQGKATAGAWPWLRKRLLSMGMVLTLGFLAIVSLVVSAVIAYFFSQEGQIWHALNFLVSVLIFAVMFALLFKYLPDVRLSWKYAFSGGSSTAVLFMIGKSLISLYLGKNAVGSAYGAAGSLVVLLAWVYYSSIIVFSGAEITRILAAKDGLPEAINAAAPKEVRVSQLNPQTT
jgi:membrane protein